MVPDSLIDEVLAVVATTRRPTEANGVEGAGTETGIAIDFSRLERSSMLGL